MTDNNHPITPSQKIVGGWEDEWNDYEGKDTYEMFVTKRAARWGWEQRGAANEAELQKARDEELEACCEWLKSEGHEYEHEALFAARRPKPPSLKKQALALIDDCTDPESDYLDDNALSIIRRALEALPDD